jgi:hypothetical protein
MYNIARLLIPSLVVYGVIITLVMVTPHSNVECEYRVPLSQRLQTQDPRDYNPAIHAPTHTPVQSSHFPDATNSPTPTHNSDTVTTHKVASHAQTRTPTFDISDPTNSPRTTIPRYVAFQKAMLANEITPRLLVAETCKTACGFGNQVEQLHQLAALAMMMNRGMLYTLETGYEFDNLCNLAHFPYTLRRGAGLAAILAHFNLTSTDVRRVSSIDEWTNDPQYPEAIVYMTYTAPDYATYTGVRAIQLMHAVGDYDTAITQMVCQPHSSVAQEIAHRMHENGKNEVRYIGMHMRTTQHALNPWNCNLDQQILAFARCLSVVARSMTTVFIVTDAQSHSDRAKIMESMQEAVAKYDVHVHLVEHTSIALVLGGDNNRASRTQADDIAHDFFLMGKMDLVLGTKGSSFSFMAARTGTPGFISIGADTECVRWEDDNGVSVTNNYYFNKRGQFDLSGVIQTPPTL